MFKKTIIALSLIIFQGFNLSTVNANDSNFTIQNEISNYGIRSVNSKSEAISIVSTANGDAAFNLTTTNPKTQVYLFVQRNGLQDLVLDGANSIHSSEVVNADGTYSYNWVGHPISGPYQNGDVIKCRFYTFGGSVQEMFPGPTPAEWSTEFIYGNSLTSYSIESSSDVNGTITPSGTVSIVKNGSQTFTIAAIAGHKIKNVFIDNQPFGPLPSYTFENVQSNHSIRVETEVNQGREYNLTVQNDGNGFTNPSSIVSVQQSVPTSIAATPNNGYQFLNWTVTNGNAAIANINASSTTVELNSDATIEARFETGESSQIIYSYVKTDGYRLLYQDVYSDGSKSTARDYVIKAVCWNPIKKGEGNPPIFSHMYEIDAPLLAAANINTVKMYSPFHELDDGIKILDKLNQYGIKVIMTVLCGYYEDVNQAISVVNKYKNHPAILMWMVGNELNYNLLYTSQWAPVPLDECIAKINYAISQIKTNDPNHPVAASWGYHPEIVNGRRVPRQDYIKINNVDADVFGIQYYPEYEDVGDSLNCFILKQPGLEHNTFEQFKNILSTRKPMFIAEYGCDSYNVFIASDQSGYKYYDWSRSHVDEAAQAKGIKYMTLEIKNYLNIYNANNPCVGGAVFAWSDEWWKIWPYDSQEIGGYDPNSPGPDILCLYPDGFFNEEYFGILDVERNPKAAYYALKDVYATY